jgi:hypothetical protein
MNTRKYAALFVALAALLVFHHDAAAHGHTDVGDYGLVIGFHNEPAYQGEPNGLDLFVTNEQTGEPVNGLEETLRVEIIFGSSTKELEIEPQFGQDGAYTAHVIPTEVGDYTWHIFGMIEETPVDIQMTSSPDTFSPVQSKDSVSFPNPEGSASATANLALVLGILGLVFGVFGLAFGWLGLRAARK